VSSTRFRATPDPGWAPATLAVHAGRAADPVHGAVVPPIHLSTTFRRDEDGKLVGQHLYTRHSNPNRAELEACLAALEGAAAALCFASGSAAAAALLQTLRPGDRVVYPADLYYGIRKQILAERERIGIEAEAVDLADPRAAAATLGRPARLVFCETPSNPLLRVSDLALLAQLAHHAGAVLVCDSTTAGPLLQRPLDLGCDIVLHATTKSLAGHSDVLGGVLITRESASPLWLRLAEGLRVSGAVPSPFDCWLALRGIATLPLRVRAQCSNAARIAAYLLAHAAVSAVHWPGLPSHPGHEVARRQMRDFGSLLSFQLRGGPEAANRFCARTRLFLRATSLGSVHSLVEHRAPVEGPGSATPPDLVRVSVGIEDGDDLLADLTKSLAGL
jgi:cystathionine gamma-synthase